MRSPLGDPVRSESVAGMDMLNDMFQRQARRLESQLYQRAQDQRTIELTQRQAQLARAQVRQLEQNHLEQAARITQGAKSLQRLQDLIRDSLHHNSEAHNACEALERDNADMRAVLERVAPEELAKLRKRSEGHASSENLRDRSRQLENALAETERSAVQQIGVTPLTSVAMSSDCNPLNDLSAVADYASKANVGARSAEAPAAAFAPALATNGTTYVTHAQPHVPGTTRHSNSADASPASARQYMSPSFSACLPPAVPMSRDPSMQAMELSRQPSFDQNRPS